MNNDEFDIEGIMPTKKLEIWQGINHRLHEMQTSDLIDAAVKLNLYVNKDLALEIAGRKDVVFWIRKRVQDPSGMRSWNDEIQWFPVHAIYILALAKTDEALDLVLDFLRYRSDDLGDFLTENSHEALAGFGEHAIEKLQKFASDETLEPFVRGSCTNALCMIASAHPERSDEIKKHLVGLFRETKNETFSGLLASDIGSFHDKSLIDEMYSAFDSGRIDKGIFEREDIEDFFNNPIDQHRSKNTDILAYFSRKNMRQMKVFDREDTEHTYEKEKIGRNDPCPCGSGKKYKKCCLRMST